MNSLGTSPPPAGHGSSWEALALLAFACTVVFLNVRLALRRRRWRRMRQGDPIDFGD